MIYEYWREILSSLAVIVWLYGYIPYFRSIFAWKTKPHLYSWWTWTFVWCVSFWAQIAWWGWWGSAMLGVTAVICAIVTILAFRYGEKTGDTIDIMSVLLAILAICIWAFTKNPLYATVLATFADAICYIPTFRKVWKKPDSEPVAYYILSTVKHSLALISLSIYTLTTILFSSSVIFMNFIILFIIYYRTRK